MYKILTLNKISNAGTGQLSPQKYTVSDNEANPDAILLRSFNMHDMDMPKSLMAIGRCGAGTNNIPVESCAQKGIVVFNTPGANANAVKELVIAGMLLSSRNIAAGVSWVQSLAGETGVAKLVEKGKSNFAGPEIAGKTLGVIGLGAIGSLVATAGAALGMRVLGHDPKATSQTVAQAESIEGIFSKSDYISLHIPLNDKTKHMFGKNIFAGAKKGMRLLNFSRGELVDNQALKDAIANGTISYYITDFPTEDLLGINQIITIPHLGASTPESEENCASMAALQIKDYLENGNIANSVNFPHCVLPRGPGKRICVIHKDADLAASVKGGNIANILSRGTYTLIELSDGNSADIETLLKTMDVVINVRVI